MLYKYINEHQIEPFTDKILRINGKIYANPSATTLKNNGYKELVKANADLREGYYISITYSDDETSIYEHVDYIKIDMF